MKLFGQIVRTVVNTAMLPLAVVADAATLGGTVNGKNDGHVEDTYTAKRLQKLKDEAADGDDQ